jgi:hypothetical protein
MPVLMPVLVPVRLTHDASMREESRCSTSTTARRTPLQKTCMPNAINRD